MKTLTPQQIVDLNPCPGYDLKQITKLFGNKESVTYLEILDTDKIPLEDIVWLFCQPDVLSASIRNQWMEVIVTRVVTNYALHCGIDTVEEWAKNWLSGNDRTIKAAYTAAYTAAVYDSAGTAAYAASHAAAAVIDAAETAEDAVNATAAACAAADDAYITALKIERKQQIQDLKDILQGESK